MSTYKLTYFPLRARAELARFVFVQAGVKYEDVRVTFEKWPELKPGKLSKQGVQLFVLSLPSKIYPSLRYTPGPPSDSGGRR